MKYTITATQTKVYEIEVEAEDPASALELLDEWNEDDFQDFIAEGGGWELEAIQWRAIAHLLRVGGGTLLNN